MRERVAALAADGGLVRADDLLVTNASLIAERHTISLYDASYVAAAEAVNAQLGSCDVRDLVSKGLALLPRDAAREDE